MMSRSVFMCLVGGLLGFLGCSTKKMPEGDLVSIEYTRSGTMAGYIYEGRLEPDSADGFVLQAMKEEHGPLFEKRIGTEELLHFRRIIVEEKMYTYKDSYQPKFEVLDGYSWHFTARFADGSKIASHGSNASPGGSGLSRIRQYMTELVADGVLLEGQP